MKKANQKKVAGKVVKMLNSYLRLDANSNSSIVINQPKAPEGLKKFRAEK